MGQKSIKDSLKMVVTGAHPGDPEFGCGGMIARYTASGHDVVLLYLNRGEAGIPGRTEAEAREIRTAEAGIAAGILKARTVFAGQTDGKGEINPARCKEYLDILERENPAIVLAHWPIDNHPDHRINSLLVYEAWVRKGIFPCIFTKCRTGWIPNFFSPRIIST